MTNKIILLVLIPLFFFNPSYSKETAPLEPPYDTETCINNKFGDCMNNCQFSRDPDCQKKCKDTAKVKCESEKPAVGKQ